MRPLEELINKEEPGIALIRSWLSESAVSYELLPPSKGSGDCLHQLQITTRSPMGALVYNTGGLLVDCGWLRFLGSGHPTMTRTLLNWNSVKGKEAFTLVADDVLGGFFAVNGGALGDDPGGVYYLPYDGLNWEALEIGFSHFLSWSLTGALDDFYGPDRWNGWQEDVAPLSGDECFSFYPFLWTEEGTVAGSRRTIVPAKEAYELKMDIRSQLLEQ